MPKIVSIDAILQDFAIKNGYFNYLNFSKKAVLMLYNLMKDEKHCSIKEAMRIFTNLQQGKMEHDNFIHSEIYKKFTYHREYNEFKKLALGLIFRDYEEVIVAGIYITDETSRYIYEKALANNCPIFVYGLELTYDAAPEHFLYQTLNFQKEKNLEIASLRKGRTISQLNTELDPNFFPEKKENKKKFQLRYDLRFCEESNEQHMVESTVTYLTDFYPDVALVTTNYCLVKKIGARLSNKENINLIFKEKYTAHPDGIFLLKLLDTAILGETDISFIALLKHPYIYEQNAEIIDCIEDSIIRTTTSKQVTQEAQLFLEKIKRWSKGFHHAKNFAEYHIKWSDAITNRITCGGKRVLEFIKKYSPRFTDIYEYRQVLSFFLGRQYFYPFTDNKRFINVFSPKEASFLTYRNAILLDCTEEDFQIRDPLVMLNLFHILSTKRSIVIFNKEKPLSRLLLQIQHSCVGNYEIKKEPTQPIETVAVVKEKLFVPIEMLPKKLSPTMIELLINDPYRFYVRYILAIKETNSVVVKPGHKEFGYIMHKVFQSASKTRFSKEEYTRILENELKTYATRYQYVKNLWLPRGLKILEQFATFHNRRLEEIDILENEKELSIFIADGLELFCRFDRIESLKEDTVNIIEFKTGTIPTFKEISSFVKPQLPLQGLILQKNRNVRFNSMMYCKPSTEKVTVKKLQSPEETIAEIHKKLTTLAQIYLSGEFDFLANITKN
ncbi:RecB family exonuclease [Neorickettsia sennetsu]|uniref:RecB family exonuclease n=1 Tax=Ehrlichia sennetsu TaxID=951 RepID=UPI001D040007|nr:PD-(D/E)XK nuclease family protein [Neorickettsia sennetsu]